MAENCIQCGGTGTLVNGEPCPTCAKNIARIVPKAYGIPVQYQGVKFDKSFLPEKEQKEYGCFMEGLMQTILNDIPFYQKNMIICSRPNSGKTVWSYDLYANVVAMGFEMPPVKDIVEIKNILNGYTDKQEAQLFSTARCAVIRIPRDVQFWMLDTISYIVERRVRSDGFTIFMFAGTEEELKYADKNDKLKYIRGTGAYNTVQIVSFD